jgi:hypothetical protein
MLCGDATAESESPAANRALGSFPPGGITLAPATGGQPMTISIQVWLLNASPQARFEVRVHGQGAPQAPFVGQADRDGHYVSGRLVMGRADPMATFSSIGWRAGSYSVDLAVDGTKVAERRFELAQLPTTTGVRALDVDFSPDVYQAIVRPTPYGRSEVSIVVPTDMRRRKTRYTLVQLVDSKVCSHNSRDLETAHPSERGVMRLMGHATVTDVLCRNGSATGQSPDVDVVLLRDAGTFVRRWQVPGGSLASIHMEQGTTFTGPVTPAERPDRDQLAQAEALAREPWLKDTETKGHYADTTLTEVRSEAQLCAQASDKRAYPLVLNLAELGHTSFDEADRYQQAKVVLGSKHATAAERASATKEARAMVRGAGQVSAAVARLQSGLKGLTRQYHPGCFRSLFPKSFQPFISTASM